MQFMRQELKSFYPATEIRQFTRIIFEYLAGFTATDLITKGDVELTATQIKFLDSCVVRLKKHEPLQYILGEAHFLDMKLEVNPATLIPRHETEELVMWICGNVGSSHSMVLDIGTGSGCIALGIKSQKPELTVEAWDVSSDALKTAEANARMNGLEILFDRVDILSFEPEKKHLQKYDIIVSNPPYVRESEKEQMEPNVLEHEPYLALFVNDNDPLVFYREISKKATRMLKEGGFLFFEINEAFGKEVKQLLSDLGFRNIEVKRDLSGKERMVKARVKKATKDG